MFGLAFVVLYDMALLGLLVVDQGRNISSSMLNTLLLANPTDVYRMVTLAGTAGVSAFAGMAGLSDAMTLWERLRSSPASLIWILVTAVARRARLLAERTMITPRAPPGIAAIVGGCGPKTATPTPPPFPLTAAGNRQLLRHEPPRTQGTQGPDHPGQPNGANLVFIGP